MKVVWGKAQAIGAKLNTVIDGITNSEDDSDNEGIVE